MFRSFPVVTILFTVSACTTLHPVEMPPETLQQKIMSEDLLKPGKRATIVTTDGVIHKIRVRSIDANSGLIETGDEAIRIGDIVAVETKDFSMGKTALLAASTYTVLLLIAIAVAPVLIL
ncbi:MAG TPA: hypothetical protein PKH39_01305 [Woeseiaceae bacterium]|nr:hypothetical protein [Woeseiaceae bacterium]